jgi:hypothetical protein
MERVFNDSGAQNLSTLNEFVIHAKMIDKKQEQLTNKPPQLDATFHDS